ncbi:MAG TPA: DUF2997 domain-containing protein [Verrucomicrobiales bacterium]|nr:DUF2997 domain-containing protein [Verrucomicrobiales bacterium]
MELHEIEVIIEADGEVKLQVRGLKGPACLEATKALEESLGSEVLNREKTHEFLEAPSQEMQDRQWQSGG